jgi:hypothetical protein
MFVCQRTFVGVITSPNFHPVLSVNREEKQKEYGIRNPLDFVKIDNESQRKIKASILLSVALRLQYRTLIGKGKWALKFVGLC